MSKAYKLIMAVAAAGALACGCNDKEYEMGTYGYDLAFLAEHNIETVELSQGDSKVMIAPGLQGRVMTSTTGGNEGASYGWINYKFVEENIFFVKGSLDKNDKCDYNLSSHLSCRHHTKYVIHAVK
mgnify:CR=1 FL=1